MKFEMPKLFVDEYRMQPVSFGFGDMGKVTFLRTYSRQDNPNVDGQEGWADVCERAINGMYSFQQQWCEENGVNWNYEKAVRSAKDAYDMMFQMKWTPPGRGLSMMGVPFVMERGEVESLQNCAFISSKYIDRERGDFFAWLMERSMLGVGVGFDTRGSGKLRIHAKPGQEGRTFMVPDNRQGWAESVRMLIDSYLNPTMPHWQFDYSLVRPRGSLIRGFGGVASGPEPLIDLHRSIRKILDTQDGQLLNSRTIVDLCNLIGKCVVSGNVRRCLPKGTLIHTRDGLVPIENICPGMAAKTSDGYAEISELIEQGTQATILIQTQLGDFECTKSHRVAVMTSPGEYTWKLASELLQGERLVFVEGMINGVNTHLPDWSYDKPLHSTTCVDIDIPTLDADMAWFIGMFHGDGYVYPNFENGGFNAYVMVACDTKHSEIINRVEQQIERFGVNINRVEPSESDKSVKVRSQSKQLAWYLSQIKVANEPISVPDFILKGTHRVRAAYVAGLFDADGSSATRPVLVASSVYPTYLKEVQSLCASLGIPTRMRLHRKARGQWRSLYHLSVVGARAVGRFQGIVTPYSSKYEDTRKTQRSQHGYGYELLGGDCKGLIPIKVNGIQPGRTVETFDISVPGAHEFVAAEGLLVHNSAEIALGDPSDSEFINLKNYDLYPERAEYGWVSNNSVFAEVGMDYSSVAERTWANGEPGYYWLENARQYGRMNGVRKPDVGVMGANPCNEQNLHHREECTLVEIFLPRCKNKQEFERAIKYAYLYGKSVTLANERIRDPQARDVMCQNRRIGLSVTGITQFVGQRGMGTLRDWLDHGYYISGYYDQLYSQWLNVNESIRRTSVKPSGTVSIVAGVTPGVHFAPAGRHHIRRIVLADDSPLVEPLQAAGYPIEPSAYTPGSVAVSFPVDAGPGVRSESDVSMDEQLQLVSLVQRHWADNAVSATVKFDREAVGPDDIKQALEHYQHRLKGISFLPSEGHGYEQAPYESIDKETYRDLMANIAPFRASGIGEQDKQMDLYCDGDACVVAV